MKKIRKGISGFTNVLVAALAGVLLICLGAAWVNTATLRMAGLATLATPLFIALNVLALVYCLIRAKRMGWVTLIALLLALSQIGNLWGFKFIPPKDTGKSSFSLMTYNVRNFDLYNWSHNDRSRDAIFDMLTDAAPDVVCFQEFYSQPGGAWDNIRELREQLGLEHYYFARELMLDPGRQWGIATFSRFPIAAYGDLMQDARPNTRGNRPYRGIYTDLLIGGDTVRVINIHLASIYLDRKDYQTLERLAESGEGAVKQSRNIIAKLLRGYKRRGEQIRQLNHFLENTPQPHPILVCGDLNDVPTSYAYNSLSRRFTDAFLKTGWGPGATYNGPIPGLRIDCVFTGEGLTPVESKVIGLRISDHYPLLTKIKPGPAR